ncbi:hypothetical protein GY45DRAFT_750993 [Cubamyces sp. BRFM 1775]|nr:hypothetical protein GY45DRAFT_750993 [Cubamyces sp. BRFM 1775]
MSDFAFNVWGAIAAVIGTLALIPTFLIWLRTCFPSALLPSLEDAFNRTEALFNKAVEAGVFTDEEEQDQFDVTLGSAYRQILDIQAQMKSRAFRQNAKNWWNGLSGRIVALCEELTSVHAKLAEKSSMERKRLATENNVADLPLLSGRKGLRNQSCSRSPASDSCSPGPEKGADPSWGMDKAAGNGTYRFVRQSSGQPTHHLISDTDLQSLLSVALSSSAEDEDTDSQRVARPSEILLDIGTRFLDSSLSDNDLGTKRSRLRDLSRLVKRVYGMRLHGHGKDTDAHGIPIDPESLVPITVDISDYDEFEFKKSVDV